MYSIGIQSRILYWVLLLHAVVYTRSVLVNDTLYQPNFLLIEPRNLAYASLSMPEGSPWCHGNKTFWLVGHQNDETPHCYNADSGTWNKPKIAVFDNNDELNDSDGNPRYIDRHGCTSLDVNKDGILDLICVVGADKGGGNGYTELYLTQADGSLKKVLHHGLQKYPTVRARFVNTLYNTADEGNITHVFISAFGTGRTDGEVNHHTMYRLIDGEPYFEEVTGLFNKNSKVMQVRVVDWNGDGRDDLIINHKSDWGMFFEQEEGGSFKKIDYIQSYRTNRMIASRLADVNGDGILDYITTTRTFRNIKKVWTSPALRVFLGVDGPGLFDFTKTYFSMILPFAAPDLEILDVNDDGIPDIYVLQTDTSSDAYCGQAMPYTFQTLPSDWQPPFDEAPDLLLIGQGGNYSKSQRFQTVKMRNEMRGCGYIVEKFGDNKTMLISNANGGHLGNTGILSW